MAKDEVTHSCVLSAELHQRLAVLASNTGRTVEWLVERILEDNLTAVESEVAAVDEGLIAAQAGRGRDAHATLEEVFSALRQSGGRVARKVS